MFRGVYTATSGMIATQRKQEMLSNNLANMSTPGYKADQAVLRSFPDLLIERIRDGQDVQGIPSLPNQNKLGILHSGVYAQEGIPLFEQGDLQHTARSLDLAIIDQGLSWPDPDNQGENIRGYLFFAVQGPEGELHYTRNGQFALDEEGYLTNAHGYYVLNQNQERIQVNSDNFLISEDGQIYTEDPNDMLAYNATGNRLWLGYTEQPERLVRSGQGLYTWIAANGEPASQPQELNEVLIEMAQQGRPVNFQLMQGYIERSNVDATQTMTEMLSMYRLFEANQKVLQAYDRNMEKLVNEVGRVF